MALDMSGHMALKLSGRRQLLPALYAVMAATRPLVHQQARFGVEALPALQTIELECFDTFLFMFLLERKL